MPLQVKISNKASLSIERLLNYLEANWSVRVRSDFIMKLDRAINLIQSQPDSFPSSTVIKGLHKCVVTKQTSLFYTYDKAYIYIVALFDNRQDPKRLRKEVKS
ncbi:MAG: plasmid stabilization protein [Bacteroidetes bacterium GWF2_49_14]|nr:MAG: plasmid stabilization protein [Bacteroidetes bacterium GWF2_49_14]HBB91617.1 type II toxin-antitoxin system RelE/ParE family toxin [Bacteroidales bacterium]